MSGFDPYKESLNEISKFDQSSIKNINKHLQSHVQGKRNLAKIELVSNNHSEVTKKKVAAYVPKNNNGEIKLKNYITMVLNCECDFEELVDTSLIRKIVNEVMLKQDYKKFVTKCQQFQ